MAPRSIATTSTASLTGLKHQHNPSDLQLFSDSSQRSLKAALLHNGSSKTSNPIAQSVQLKETSVNMKMLLEAMQYNVHRRNVCGNLKAIEMLIGTNGSLQVLLLLTPLGL
jgi:hypothetical protein